MNNKVNTPTKLKNTRRNFFHIAGSIGIAFCLVTPIMTSAASLDEIKEGVY